MPYHDSRAANAAFALNKNPAASGTGRSEERRSAVGRVRRVDLVQEVAARLEEQILSGQFAPGQAIPPEGRLSVQLGVSRTVIREAMRILGARGLVAVSQGKSPRVKPADPTHVADSIAAFLQRTNHSLRHLVEVRRHLETSIASLAAQRATPDQIAVMEEAIDELAAAQSLDSQIAADMRFHTLLADATGNPVFGLLLQPLTHLLQWSLKETLGRTGAKRAAECHELILAAVRQGDPEAARQAMLDLVAMAEHDLGMKADAKSKGQKPNKNKPRQIAQTPSKGPKKFLLRKPVLSS
jgi:DNA-binding FadR family transcriptional regulator